VLEPLVQQWQQVYRDWWLTALILVFLGPLLCLALLLNLLDLLGGLRKLLIRLIPQKL
jgi:hypothetical protein